MSWVETARLTVEKIKKKRVETEELVHGTDCERSELSEKRFLDNSPSYQSGWSKVFPVKGDPFWEKDGRRIKITGAELERLKSTNAGEEEKES